MSTTITWAFGNQHNAGELNFSGFTDDYTTVSVVGTNPTDASATDQTAFLMTVASGWTIRFENAGDATQFVEGIVTAVDFSDLANGPVFTFTPSSSNGTASGNINVTFTPGSSPAFNAGFAACVKNIQSPIFGG